MKVYIHKSRGMPEVPGDTTVEAKLFVTLKVFFLAMKTISKLTKNITRLKKKITELNKQLSSN